MQGGRSCQAAPIIPPQLPRPTFLAYARPSYTPSYSCASSTSSRHSTSASCHAKRTCARRHAPSPAAAASAVTHLVISPGPPQPPTATRHQGASVGILNHAPGHPALLRLPPTFPRPSGGVSLKP